MRTAHRVYTDEAAAYKGLPNHETVKHSVSEYVNGQAHTNGMESFWGMLKRGYHGTYHRMSPKHLQRYVNEFSGRHNIRPLDTIQQMAGHRPGARGQAAPVPGAGRMSVGRTFPPDAPSEMSEEQELFDTPDTFEGFSHDNGDPFWWKSDLQALLGYKGSDSFEKPVGRAIQAMNALSVSVTGNVRHEKRVTEDGGGERDDCKLFSVRLPTS